MGIDVYEWLERVGRYEEILNAKLAERERLMSLATRITPNMDGMPRAAGGVSDRVGSAAVKLAALSTDTDEMFERYAKHKQAVTEALVQLPKNEFGALHRRYIQHMTWFEVAADMDKSCAQVFRYHSAGIQRLQEILQEKTPSN